MIGTVYNNQHLFRDFDNIIIDECHNVGADAGMYNEFIKATPRAKVLGLTATPYRLNSGVEGSRLEFLNRTNPRIFDDCIYYIQNDVLFDAGHLAPLKYFSFNTIDRTKIQLKADGSDFKTSALHAYLKQADMASAIVKYAKVLEKTCRNTLIFCSSIEEAERVQRGLPGSAIVTGETEDDERRQILSAFTSGKITKLINVGVLTTGFDYPALESILNGRITMSLALYYQIIGRVMRPYTFADGTKKIGYVVDLGGNIELFGKIETMKIMEDDRGQLSIWNGGRQLTNVPFTRN
jgi:DNA repair protein RadD